MELRDYLIILKRRFWIIFIVFVVTVVIVVVGSYLITPTYASTTTLRVAIGASASAGIATGSDTYYADRLLNTYLTIATSGPLINQVVQETGMDHFPVVSAEIIPNTELFKISVEDSDPFIAQAVAEKIGLLLVAQSQQFYTGSGKSPLEVISEQVEQLRAEVEKAQNTYDLLFTGTEANPGQVESAKNALSLIQNIYYNLLAQSEQISLRAQIQANIVSIIEPAILQMKPAKPNIIMNGALGCMVGLMGGLGLAFLIENLSGTRVPSSILKE